MARKQILVQVDVDLLDRLDRYAKSEFGGNRSRSIAEGVELLLAQHAVFLQRHRNPPPGGGWLPGPQRTPDKTPVADRPLTHDLREGHG